MDLDQNRGVLDFRPTGEVAADPLRRGLGRDNAAKVLTVLCTTVLDTYHPWTPTIQCAICIDTVCLAVRSRGMGPLAELGAAI